MAVRKFLTDIDFSQNQSISRVIENRTTPPATPVEGQEYYDVILNKAFFFDGSSWVEYGGVGVTSVGLTMPPAFSVTNTPITTAGDINVTANGVASQYIRGDGQLATLPTNTGGGGSVTYYLNGSINQGTFGGNTYYQMSRNAITGGVGTDFSISTDGFIARFITDANDPNVLQIPVGAWNLGFFFSASSGGGSPKFYVNIYKTDGTTFTLLGTNSATPENITGGTTIDQYFFSVAIPTNTLLATDRIAIDIFVIHSSRTITLHTEDSHLCEVITTLSTGITALNGLTDQTQYFAVGTSGTDFGVSSSGDTHTFNLPFASATETGKLSSTDWNTFNNKANNNIYTADGTLTGIRTVNLLNYALRFLGSGGTSTIRLDQNNGAGLLASIIETLNNITLQVINGSLSASFDVIANQIESNVTGTTATAIITQQENQIDLVVTDGVTTRRISIDLTSGVTINNEYILPNTDGTAGQVMTTDGAGNVTFQTPTADVNIYNTDGTLTGNRAVELNGQTLLFEDNSLIGGQFQVIFDNGSKISQLFIQNTNYLLSVFNGTNGSSVSGTTSQLLLTVQTGASSKSLKINTTGLQVNGTYYLPNTDGTAGQVMTTNGAGVTSWASLPSAVNIYNTDGTLTADRTVDLNGKGLYFQDASVLGSIFSVNIDNGTKLGTISVNNAVFDLEIIEAGKGAVITGTSTYLLLKYIGASGVKQLQIDNGGLRINGQYYLPNLDGTAGQVMTTDGAGNVTFQTPSSGTNIYNSNGTLTSARTLTGGGFDLTFDTLNTFINNISPSGGTQGYVINVNTLLMSGSIGTRIFKVVDTNAGTERLGILRNGNVRFNNAYTFPLTDGTPNQVLATNGAGVISFQDVTAIPSFIPYIQEAEIRRGCVALNNSTTLGTYGAYTPVVTGSAVALVMSTTTATKLPKQRILTSTGATNSTVAIIFGSQSYIQSLEQGFRFVGSYVFSDVSAGGTEWFVPNARQFCGLVGSTVLIPISSTITVASQTNIIGLGSDVGDTNLQIFHNDATGVATKIDLGASFPANKTGAVANGVGYQLELYAPFGATTVNYRVTKLTDGTQVTGTISSNLPANTTLLCPQVCRTSGSTSQNVSIDFIQLNAYTLN